MKRNKFLITGFIILVVGIIFIQNKYLKVYQQEKDEKQQIEDILLEKNMDHETTELLNHELLQTEDSSSTESEIISDSVDDSKFLCANDNTETYDCIIKIPDINLEKFVYTGIQREKHLENYELITACSDMEYSNGGNYIICGHASRLYGHSLNRLHELEIGDKIYIEDNDFNDEYHITCVTYEDRNKTKDYYTQTSQNIITIVSCAKNISKESYIVIQAAKN